MTNECIHKKLEVASIKDKMTEQVEMMHKLVT